MAGSDQSKPNIREMEIKGDVEGLIKALKHVDSNVRIQAVEALGNIGDERAIGPLNQYWRARGSYSAQSAINKIKNKNISEENSSNSNSNLKSIKSNSKGWWSSQSKNNKIGIGFLSCILGIVVLVGIFGTLTSNSVQNDATTVNDNITHPEAQNVIVLSSNGSREGDVYYIVNGEVQNNNTFGVSFVKMNVTAYDSNGNMLQSNTTYAYANSNDVDLPAQGKANFELYFDDPNHEIVKYIVKVQDADKSLYEFDMKDKAIELVKNYKGAGPFSVEEAINQSLTLAESTGTKIETGLWNANLMDDGNYDVSYQYQEDVYGGSGTLQQETVEFKTDIETGKVIGLNSMGKDMVGIAEGN